jgi:UDP-glucose:(heptosyl)LPS alpha-1,3-glucosyltransferase
MKIALIIERMDIQLGGAERSISELSKALSDQGLDVTLLAAKGQSSDPQNRVLCEPSGKRTSHAVFAQALKRHLKDHAYDIVHTVLPFDFADIYQPRGGSYAETIVQSAASYKNPVIRKLKQVTAFTNRRRQQWLTAERALSSGPKGPTIAALSLYVANQFKHHYGTADDRIKIIRNGVNTHRHIESNSIEPFRQQVRERLGLSPDTNPVFFLFGAHNFRLKGLAPLIHALAISNEKNAILLIAGHGHQTDYRKLVEKYNLKNQVLFLGATLHIPDLLAACHAAVLPTFYDPASRFILEALAAQKPVITTRFNGACDLFEHNRHGLIIDSPINTDALASALNTLTQEQTRQTMVQAIKQDNLIEKVSIERVAHELIALYTEILNKKGQS